MTDEKQNVLDIVMSFLDSYSQKNIEKCISAMTASKPILLFGTNDDEVFRTADDIRAALNRDFSSMNDIRWGKHRNLYVETSPSLASVIIELPLSYQSEGKNIETLFRYALTLIKENSQWKICSGMASVPFSAGTYTFSK